MSKLFKNFVGIDISKIWFDAALIKADEPSIILHEQFSPKARGIQKNANLVAHSPCIAG